MIHPTAKMSEGANRNFPARNTLVQLLVVHSVTDRQTDGRHANSRSYCVAVRSAKNQSNNEMLLLRCACVVMRTGLWGSGTSLQLEWVCSTNCQLHQSLASTPPPPRSRPKLKTVKRSGLRFARLSP